MSRIPCTPGSIGVDTDDHPDLRGQYTVPIPPGIIRIIKTPAGEAPESIRHEWVGIEMPAICHEASARGLGGAVSGKIITPDCRYIVRQDEAINALAKKSITAAGWWWRKGFPQGDDCFTFATDEAVEVTPVHHK